METGELNRMLGKIGRFHWRLSYTEFAKYGITQGQPRILRYLSSHEGCIQRELCDNCHLEPASVTNILAIMERDELISRQYEPGNRRSLQVFLTSKGQEAMQHVEQVHQLIGEESFCDFNEDEKEQVKAYFERILTNLKKAEEQSKNETVQ